MGNVKLANGHIITTFLPPPKNFNFLEADDKELIMYGFPRKPVENEKLLSLWKKAMSKRHKHIVPAFSISTIKHKK